LQDVGGGHFVDDFRAALAAHIRFADQEPVDRGGGEPLVPERQRQVAEFQQVFGEGADGLAARTFAAIHVDRQAHNQTADPAPLDQVEKRLGIVRKALAAADGFDRRCNHQSWIGNGEANSFDA